MRKQVPALHPSSGLASWATCQGNALHRVLDDAVVDLSPRTGEEARQRLVSVDGIPERLGPIRMKALQFQRAAIQLD
jgi:hypothetical protein